MNNKENMLAAIKGEMGDRIVYAPRIDVWYNANKRAGTLPPGYENLTRDEISIKEGWAPHKALPDFLDMRSEEDMMHRALGIHPTPHYPYRIEFSSDIEIRIHREGGSMMSEPYIIAIEYITPDGTVTTKMEFSEDLWNSGSTYAHITKHAIQGPEDYKPLAYIFGTLKVIPDYEGLEKWIAQTGDSSLCFSYATYAAAPVQAVQRDLINPTEFFIHYHDYPEKMEMLARSMEDYYEGMLNAALNSPAQVIGWGGNYDDTITYPTYFEKELKSRLIETGERLRRKGKFLTCHTDGENKQLLRLLTESKLDIAEAICPFPMTKVKIEDYYSLWKDKTTIYGGIPSNILVPELVSDIDFKDFADNLFKNVVPGKRLILSVADTTPPGADFDRLRYFADKVRTDGSLPLKAGTFNPVQPQKLEDAKVQSEKGGELKPQPGIWETVQRDVLEGDQIKIVPDVEDLLNKGESAKDILDKGLLPVMEMIGTKFTDGTVFIPEVLLSARVMNNALEILEPHFKETDEKTSGLIMMGTVKGDLHDIGKNMVSTMIKGQGYDVIDLGIDVPTKTFIEKVKEYKPDVLGLSALLTTTMPMMANVIEALKEASLGYDLKIMVGGAPLTEAFALSIGADAYAADAGQAAAYCKSVLK